MLKSSTLMKTRIELRVCDTKMGVLGEGVLTAQDTTQISNIQIQRFDTVTQQCSGLISVATLRDQKSYRKFVQLKNHQDSFQLKCRLHVLTDYHNVHFCCISGRKLLLVGMSTLLVFKIDSDQGIKPLFVRNLSYLQLGTARFVTHVVCYRNEIFIMLNDHNIYTISTENETAPQIYTLPIKTLISFIGLSDNEEYFLMGTGNGSIIVTDLKDEFYKYQTDCGEICGVSLRKDILHALGTCGRSMTISTSHGLLIQKSSQYEIAWRMAATHGYCLSVLVPDSMLLQYFDLSKPLEYRFRASINFGNVLDSIRTVGLQATKIVSQDDYTKEEDDLLLSYTFTQDRCLYFQHIFPYKDDLSYKLGYPALMCKFGESFIELWSFNQKSVEHNDEERIDDTFPYAIHAVYDNVCYVVGNVGGQTVLCEMQVPPGNLKQRQK